MHRTDTIPPHQHSEYLYSLSPMEDDLPIPANILMYFFLHPASEYGNRKIWLDRIPKDTSVGLQLDQITKVMTSYKPVGVSK